MRDLYGADIGTSIEFRGEGTLIAQHPWPEETNISAGHGVVFSRSKGTSYRTLFMEAYPPEGGFLRGEGPTMAACEDAAWAKYQLMLTCTEPTGHEFVPRGYHYETGPDGELVFTCKDCLKEGPRTLEELFDEIFSRNNPDTESDPED